MKWDETHHELLKLSLRLYEEGLPKWSEVTTMYSLAEEEIRELEYRHEKIVERTARAFAEAKSLPTLTSEQRLMFSLRVHYAKDFVHGIQVGPKGIFSQPSVSRQRLYRWLLIDLWEHAGFPTIHGIMESLLFGWHPDKIRMGKN